MPCCARLSPKPAAGAAARGDLAARADHRDAPDWTRAGGANPVRGARPEQRRRSLLTAWPKPRATRKWSQLATQLIDRQTGRYDPADVEDRYETRLRAMIDAKLKGEGRRAEARRAGRRATSST